MSYVKTNWVDNVTPANAANMNKIENELVELESKQTELSARPRPLQMSIETREWESLYRNKTPYRGKVVFAKIDGAQEDLDAMREAGCHIVLLRRRKVQPAKTRESSPPFLYKRGEIKWSLTSVSSGEAPPQYPFMNEFALPAKVGEWSPLYSLADNKLAVVSDVVKGYCVSDDEAIYLRSIRGTKSLNYISINGASVKARYAFAIRRPIAEKDFWDPATGNMTPKVSDSHHITVLLCVNKEQNQTTFNALTYAIAII